MKRSIGHGPAWTSTQVACFVGTFLWAAMGENQQSSAQTSLPNYGKGYGFSGGVGWGTLPSTPPSRGSGLSSQFSAGLTPSNSIRIPSQYGNQPYVARRYGYYPYGQRPSSYRYGRPIYGRPFVPYGFGYGYSTYGLQLNAYPGGITQTFQGPIGW